MEGDFIQGMLHGYGRHEKGDGIIYEGEFQKGMAHGKAKVTLPNGAFYEGDFVDVRDYLHKFRMFHAQEDFHLVGFNTLDKQQNWEGRLVRQDELILDLKLIRDLKKPSFLVCLNGKPIVNDKTMKRYEYAQLDSSKEYSVELNQGVLGIFFQN